MATPGSGAGLLMSTTGGPRAVPASQLAPLAADFDFEHSAPLSLFCNDAVGAQAVSAETENAAAVVRSL